MTVPLSRCKKKAFKRYVYKAFFLLFEGLQLTVNKHGHKYR